MSRSLAILGVLVFLCATLSGCVYHDGHHGHYRGYGRRWDSGYGYGGHHHGGYYRTGYHHRYHRDYCD
jgi:hypothetical protein